MKDLKKAARRIMEAIYQKEKICVFGDYDVDGTTAVSLVASYLRSYYPNVATGKAEGCKPVRIIFL